MVRKTQNIKSLLYGADDIILFVAYCMVASPGMGMIICAHGILSFSICNGDIPKRYNKLPMLLPCVYYTTDPMLQATKNATGL
jgi:hypothetical protein